MEAKFSTLNKWLLIVVIVSSAGCLPVTNRTSYDAFSVLPEPGTSSATITEVPIVTFCLRRQNTSKVYPFVSYLGEKGDFALGVHLFGVGARPYKGLILKSVVIESSGKVYFETRDSSLVRFKRPYEQYGVHARQKEVSYYYVSDYTISLPDSVKKPYLRAEYDLVTRDNVRERRTLYTLFYIDRSRGLGSW